jgi:feruloyl esterase
MTRISANALFALAAATLGLLSAPARAGNCSDLASVALENATVTAATSVPAGEFTTPDQIGYGSLTFDVPAFCRVQLTIGTATAEVWLPDAWNNRLSGWGNGGELGAIIYQGLYFGIASGFVSVSSDLGHQSYDGNASWAFGRPDLVKEFGYTATHDMTVAAKTLTEVYYGTAPAYAYFLGGSAGGRQALMEAERYPTDYNGIGSLYPVQGWTHAMAGMIAEELKLGGSADSDAQLSDDQALALNAAVVKKCDKLDGLRDGLIEDPTQCHFDPAVMACSARHNRAGCFSAAQVAATRALYQPLTQSSGKVVYAGLPYGSEYEWSCSVLHDAFNLPFANSWFQNEVYTPAWDFHTFNPDVDVPNADEAQAHALNAWSPDLDAFRASGGKLIIGQGQADAIVVPQNTIDYYRKLLRRYGGHTGGFARLYMIPGSGHCGPPQGPNAWDVIGALIPWVEHGTAPDSIVAKQYNDDGSLKRTRPLCPWPKLARYSGFGDVNDWRNFTCKE